ncbi:uncharacterized protein I303_101988 [Kwoniella dejecticola CBS 10117]|uniref:Calcineurin-like phosphoesterase domain-containing protein n=1 Tax=Kwoniella dejecticola CBS 10117 TaxID=1296121 RepID=A0A1A6AC75_9TREE|nr:uncharacterized protein I303_01875 [Kwoniella dejecticola CBS 10117]OBR87667.1 hypothetical protein I303_01875 [Kwoniella dejecticola CBS 10117]
MSSPPPSYDPPINPNTTTNTPPSPSQLPSPSTSPSPERHLRRDSRRPGHMDLRPNLKRSKPSILDELLPTPTTLSDLNHNHSYRSSSSSSDSSLSLVIRRAGSVAIISIFLLSITFMASTSTSSVGLMSAGGREGLKAVFGGGSHAEISSLSDQVVLPGNQGEASETDNVDPNADGSEGDGGNGSDSDSETDEETTPEDLNMKKPEIDFDRYKLYKVLPPGSIDIESTNKRLIFIGDIHGSYDPLLRLMDKISYNPSTDRLIHVGDLIAKGPKNTEVLTWMRDHEILGVRGNHDQAVVQWRSWMEWAGGKDWPAYIDSLSFDDEKSASKELQKHGKGWPKGWKWKSEHWELARNMPDDLFQYILDLPLVLHLPTLHTIVVHAGLLPFDPTKPSSANIQPLIQFSNVSASNYDMGMGEESIRNSQEMSILLDVPQNTVPWNLIEMRSVYMKGKKRGKVTKSSKKGTPWSEVWNKELKRCKGHKTENTRDNLEVYAGEEEKRQKPGSPTSAVEEMDSSADLGCSPVTIVYGHAAGRGLDIKPFSKGIDTGCVYGKDLTVLVLGDVKGLKGESVNVGEHQGLLVSEACGKGGT